MKTDKEILDFILSNIDSDGYSWWLPEWMVCEDGDWHNKPSISEARQYIIQRMNQETNK